jgi:hypothetical protein
VELSNEKARALGDFLSQIWNGNKRGGSQYSSSLASGERKQMTEDEAVLLTHWRDFLTEQSAHFNKSIVQQTGKPYVADEAKAAFLLVDEELVKNEIEKAVRAFVDDTSRPHRWPPLKPRECLHLDFRASIGLAVIAEIVKETPIGMIFKKGAMPDLKNFRSGVQRLFLHYWKIGGKPFLTAMADDFIEKRRAQTH